MIKYGRFDKWLILIWVSIALLTGLIWVARERIELLIYYKQLVSSDEIRQRLEYVPQIKSWRYIEDNNKISIGCAEFTYPFGTIASISSPLAGVIINSPSVRTVISCPVSYIEIKTLQNLENEPDCNYKQRAVLKGGKVVLVPYELSEREKAICKMEAIEPYSFKQRLMMSQPKSFFAIMCMDMDELYLYEYMLELKNAELKNVELNNIGVPDNGNKAFFFETDYIKGFVTSSKKKLYSNANSPRSVGPIDWVISIWDPKKKIHQLIIVNCSDKLLLQDEIKKLCSSYRYVIDSIPDDYNDLRNLISNSIKQFPEFEIDNANNK